MAAAGLHTRADASNAGTSTDTGYSVATLVPTMTWSGQNATQYELSIVYYPYGTSNSAYDTLLSGSAVSQGIPAGVLQNGVKYRWNLQATNATGQSAPSAITSTIWMPLDPVAVLT